MREQINYWGDSSREDSPGVPCFSFDTLAGSVPYRVLVDPGVEAEGDEDIISLEAKTWDLVKVDDDKKIDAVILTHGHNDHVGGGPFIVQQDILTPEAKFLATPQTSQLLSVMAQAGKRPGCGYGDLEVFEIRERRIEIPNPGVFEILPGLETFWTPVGHNPGAAGIGVPFACGKIGFVTGDMSRHDQAIVKGFPLPSEAWPKEWIPDFLITTDLTYGSSGNRIPYSEVRARLVAQTKINYSRGRKTVIGAFSTGRGPSLIKDLHDAGIPVYVDGMIRDTYLIFQQCRWSELDNPLPLLGEASDISPVESVEHRKQLIESKDPWVVVTTGGMGDFGPIIQYFEALLPDPETSFFFTSWLSPRSNGYKLVNLNERQQKLYADGKAVFLIRNTDRKGGRGKDRLIEFKAKIDHFHLGSHISLDEFAQFIADIVVKCRNGKPLDWIGLTHGSKTAKRNAALALRQYTKDIIYGERYSRRLVQEC